MKKTPPRTVKEKKAAVSKRINRLDPNNNKNLPGSRIIRRRGKKVHDDGFEHRTSRETAK
jgi:hypothetical protein